MKKSIIGLIVCMLTVGHCFGAEVGPSPEPLQVLTQSFTDLEEKLGEFKVNLLAVTFQTLTLKELNEKVTQVDTEIKRFSNRMRGATEAEKISYRATIKDQVAIKKAIEICKENYQKVVHSSNEHVSVDIIKTLLATKIAELDTEQQQIAQYQKTRADLGDCQAVKTQYQKDLVRAKRTKSADPVIPQVLIEAENLEKKIADTQVKITEIEQEINKLQAQEQAVKDVENEALKILNEQLKNLMSNVNQEIAILNQTLLTEFTQFKKVGLDAAEESDYVIDWLMEIGRKIYPILQFIDDNKKVFDDTPGLKVMGGDDLDKKQWSRIVLGNSHAEYQELCTTVDGMKKIFEEHVDPFALVWMEFVFKAYNELRSTVAIDDIDNFFSVDSLSDKAKDRLDAVVIEAKEISSSNAEKVLIGYRDEIKASIDAKTHAIEDIINTQKNSCFFWSQEGLKFLDQISTEIKELLIDCAIPIKKAALLCKVLAERQQKDPISPFNKNNDTIIKEFDDPKEDNIGATWKKLSSFSQFISKDEHNQTDPSAVPTLFPIIKLIGQDLTAWAMSGFVNPTRETASLFGSILSKINDVRKLLEIGAFSHTDIEGDGTMSSFGKSLKKEVEGHYDGEFAKLSKADKENPDRLREVIRSCDEESKKLAFTQEERTRFRQISALFGLYPGLEKIDGYGKAYKYQSAAYAAYFAKVFGELAQLQSDGASANTVLTEAIFDRDAFETFVPEKNISSAQQISDLIKDLSFRRNIIVTDLTDDSPREKTLIDELSAANYDAGKFVILIMKNAGNWFTVFIHKTNDGQLEFVCADPCAIRRESYVRSLWRKIAGQGCQNLGCNVKNRNECLTLECGHTFCKNCLAKHLLNTFLSIDSVKPFVLSDFGIMTTTIKISHHEEKSCPMCKKPIENLDTIIGKINNFDVAFIDHVKAVYAQALKEQEKLCGTSQLSNAGKLRKYYSDQMGNRVEVEPIMVQDFDVQLRATQCLAYPQPSRDNMYQGYFVKQQLTQDNNLDYVFAVVGGRRDYLQFSIIKTFPRKFPETIMGNDNETILATFKPKFMGEE